MHSCELKEGICTCTLHPGEQCTCGLSIKDLSVTLGGIEILKNISASIPCGKITALIGPNGGGKTTLLLAILGLVPYEGTIEFHHIDTKNNRGGKIPVIGYVPQNLQFDRGDPLTVADFMALSIQRAPLWLGHRRWALEKALKYLQLLGADNLISAPMGKLSGGELQRVLLASTLQLDPHMVLLDEPISGVDVAGERLFCKFLSEFTIQHGMTILLVTHDLSVVSEHADNVICLNKQIRFQGRTKDVLTTDKLNAIFGLPEGLFTHAEAAHVHGKRDSRNE